MSPACIDAEMAALTRWVLAHKKTVVFAWLVVMIAAFAAVQPTAESWFRSVSILPVKAAKTQHHQYFSALYVPTWFV